MFQLACPGIANRMTSLLINQPLSWAFLKSPEFKAQKLVTYSSSNCHIPFLLHSSPISCSHTCSVAVLLSQPKHLSTRQMITWYCLKSIFALLIIIPGRVLANISISRSRNAKDKETNISHTAAELDSTQPQATFLNALQKARA